MMAWLALLLHAGLMAAAAPVLAGLGAWVMGRGAVHPMQAWRDLRRLWRKQPVRPEHGLPQAVVPALCLAATAVAALLPPSFALGTAAAPLADLLVLAGLLAVPPAALALAGYDSGPAGALASGRAGLARLGVEPAALVLILVVVLLTGSPNLHAASAAMRDGASLLRASLLGAGAAAVLLVLADDGDHALLAAYGGRDLAVLRFAGQLRRVVWLSLIGAVFLPLGIAAEDAGPLAWMLGVLCWAVKTAVLGLGLAALGPVRALLRPTARPELAALAGLLALLAAAVLFTSQGTA